MCFINQITTAVGKGHHLVENGAYHTHTHTKNDDFTNHFAETVVVLITHKIGGTIRNVLNKFWENDIGVLSG